MPERELEYEPALIEIEMADTRIYLARELQGDLAASGTDIARALQGPVDATTFLEGLLDANVSRITDLDQYRLHSGHPDTPVNHYYQVAFRDNGTFIEIRHAHADAPRPLSELGGEASPAGDWERFAREVNGAIRADTRGRLFAPLEVEDEEAGPEPR